MLTFISGGARSGKSSFAEKYALGLYNKNEKYSTLSYIATAVRTDREMEDRIARHIRERDSIWQTIEAPVDILTAIENRKDREIILLDCLTVWLNNIMFNEAVELVRIKEVVSQLINISREKQIALIVVSNDLNEGIPVDHLMVHEYMYNLEQVHALLTANADIVYQVVAGIQVKWKG